MINGIRSYIMTCPHILGTVNINCLGATPGSWSIDSMPAEPVIKTYCDGATLRQYRFNLSLRDAYDENIGENKRLAEVLEAIEQWVYEQNSNGILPEVENEGAEAFSIKVLRSAYLVESTVDSARWQIEFCLIYRQN